MHILTACCLQQCYQMETLRISICGMELVVISSKLTQIPGGSLAGISRVASMTAELTLEETILSYGAILDTIPVDFAMIYRGRR